MNNSLSNFVENFQAAADSFSVRLHQAVWSVKDRVISLKGNDATYVGALRALNAPPLQRHHARLKTRKPQQ
jgi:hypothetical protein